MRTCAYCGKEGHRSWRCQFSRRSDWIAVAVYLGWAAVIIVLAAAIAGCTVAPDTLCRAPRPTWRSGDTELTRKEMAQAATLWDARCTVRGWVTR
jgi:hypothetical protein